MIEIDPYSLLTIISERPDKSHWSGFPVWVISHKPNKILMKNNANLLALVKEALARDSKLKSCLDNVYIFVNHGAVIISGSVPHDLLKVAAKKIVSSVPGVNLVIDDLRVEPARPHRVGVQIDWANGSMALI